MSTASRCTFGSSTCPRDCCVRFASVPWSHRASQPASGGYAAGFAVTDPTLTVLPMCVVVCCAKRHVRYSTMQVCVRTPRVTAAQAKPRLLCSWLATGGAVVPPGYETSCRCTRQLVAQGTACSKCGRATGGLSCVNKHSAYCLAQCGWVATWPAGYGHQLRRLGR